MGEENCEKLYKYILGGSGERGSRARSALGERAKPLSIGSEEESEG